MQFTANVLNVSVFYAVRLRLLSFWVIEAEGRPSQLNCDLSAHSKGHPVTLSLHLHFSLSFVFCFGRPMKY